MTGLNNDGGGGNGAIATGSGAGGSGAAAGLTDTVAGEAGTAFGAWEIGRRNTKYAATPDATTSTPSMAATGDFFALDAGTAGFTGMCKTTGGGGATGGGIGTVEGTINGGPPPASTGGTGFRPGIGGTTGETGAAASGTDGLIGTTGTGTTGVVASGDSFTGGGALIEVSGLSFRRGISPGVGSYGTTGGGA